MSKPYTKFGPDIQRNVTLYILSLPVSIRRLIGQYQTKRSTTGLLIQGNCSNILISLFKISYYNSNNAPPPPFAVHSIKLIIDTTQFFPFEGGPSSVRGSHTPNLVQIFKGLVTLYAFSPFQFTIRHTIAPCRIQPVSDQTW